MPVEFHGPLFDGSLDNILHDMFDTLGRDVAKMGADEVGKRLIKVLKHPTGFYESRIRSQRTAAFENRVNDSRVIYGNWLEGTGSRNRPRPGFPGYHTFELVTLMLEKKLEGQLGHMIQPFINRLN